VRDLRGVLDRERAAMGVLIFFQPPTGPKEDEAASAGFYAHKLNEQQYPLKVKGAPIMAISAGCRE
jgi:hypothetical protein